MNPDEEIEKLVFEDCRFNYIKQTSSEYRKVSAFIFAFTCIFAITFLYIWFKKRDLPRIAARPVPIVILLFSVYFHDIVGSWLVLATSDNVNFLNSCAFRIMSRYITAYGFLMAAVLKLLFYYYRYRLCVHLTKQQNEPIDIDAEKNATFLIGDKKATILHSYTTTQFFTKTIIFVGLFGYIIFGILAYLICPDINSNPPISCPNDDGTLTLVIFCGIALVLLCLIISVTYATIHFHDPFGIVREVLVVTLMYILQIIVYAALTTIFVPGEKTHPITPISPTSVISFFQFVTAFPLQIFLGRKHTVEELSLTTILETPTLKLLFRLHLHRELSDERYDFYFAVEQYKVAFDNDENVENLATSIIERFVAVRSEKEINVGFDERQLVLEVFRENKRGERNVFDDLQASVLGSMRETSYFSFLRGPLYRLYLGLNTIEVEDLNPNFML